jgi:hypothetical protein
LARASAGPAARGTFRENLTILIAAIPRDLERVVVPFPGQHFARLGAAGQHDLAFFEARRDFGDGFAASPDANRMLDEAVAFRPVGELDGAFGEEGRRG